uniref:HpcH/HpaI aldolase/citrate lyase family protein n=1 Tax=Roseobacter sp. TaxID=1907202 RepID=UPI0025D0684F
PASRTRALEKARELPADAVIFDLEDAVAPEEKEGARATLAKALSTGGYGRRLKIVRINGLDTSWGAQDARAAAETDADAILLPKVNSAADLDSLAGVSGGKPLWAMMETPMGMLNAAEIAAHRQLDGMVMGTNDLAKDIVARYRADRLPLMSGLGLCLLAAKAHGRAIVDGVYNAFRDEDGLKAECEQGRDMGFDGKTLIHPAQISVANDAFSPTPEDVDLAVRQIEAYEVAVANGEAVAVVDGRIVENLHVATARETLAKVKAIKSMNAE